VWNPARERNERTLLAAEVLVSHVKSHFSFDQVKPLVVGVVNVKRWLLAWADNYFVTPISGLDAFIRIVDPNQTSCVPPPAGSA
jgi:hypothetical protein